MTNLKQAIQAIFPNGVPVSALWTDKYQIFDILNKVGSINESNHMFYPSGGGLDLKGATDSFEPNCIEIITSFNEIINPKKLTFHSFENDENYDWAYFRLEANDLNESNVYKGDMGYDEELTEIAPLDYIDRIHWDDNEYNEEPLPTGSRLVVRRLKGTFVIFGKDSSYNHHSPTYDGRHEKFNDQQFRDYIDNIRINGW